MRSRVRWAAHLVLAASACAGAPVEAGPTSEDTTGTTEFPTTMSSTTNATTLETSQSQSQSNSDSNSDGMDATSEDPATTSADATTGSTADTGAETANASSDTTVDPSAGTSGDDAESDEESESSTGDPLGGCLGPPLREQAPAECSDNSNTNAQLEVVNNCAYDIDVYWVGYDCGEDYYGTIGPNEGWAFGTYATHPWRVREAGSNDLLLEIPPLAGDTMITVQ